MLSKRLYKKPTFWVLLLFIPLCVGFFAGAAQESSGFVHIVLAAEQADDPTATALMDKLLASDGLVHFEQMPSKQAALEAVQTGQADEAWIFPADTESQIADYVSGKAKYIVQTVTREESIAMKLAREKLSATVYTYCAKAYYIAYVRSEFSQLDHLSDAQLGVYFEEASITEDLFVYGNPADSADNPQVNYLTSPIRGLLAVLLLLCGMAATLYYLQDEAAGTFSWVRQSRKELTALCCILTAIANISVMVLLALCFSSLSGNVFREVGALALYGLCCGVFCLLLKQIFATIRSYAAVIPLFAVVLLGICPVFFDFRGWYPVQHIFPPTYYVNAAYDSKYFLYMMAYIPVCLGIAFLLSQLRKLLKK